MMHACFFVSGAGVSRQGGCHAIVSDDMEVSNLMLPFDGFTVLTDFASLPAFWCAADHSHERTLFHIEPAAMYYY